MKRGQVLAAVVDTKTSYWKAVMKEAHPAGGNYSVAVDCTVSERPVLASQ